jgi:hypothetical protein
MAIATSTAIAIGTSVLAAGASAGQAVSASQAARKASRTAEESFNKAMNELSANKIAGLSLQREAYDLEREALLSAGAEAMQAGRESERGAAAIAGQVYRGQTEGQRRIAGAMGQELMGLEAATAQEEARLAGARANLNLAEAEGAQAAAAQFGAQKDAAIKGAFSSLQTAGQQYMEGSELFKESEGVKEFGKLSDLATKDGIGQEEFQRRLVDLSKNPNFANLSGVGYSATGLDAQGNPLKNVMTPLALQGYMGSQGKDYNQKLREAYLAKYPLMNPEQKQFVESVKTGQFTLPGFNIFSR